MGQNADFASADIVMLGLPFDGTVSNRPGARFAPEQIRLASWGLEDYSPRFDKHLQDVNFHDAGDLELPLGNTYRSLDVIEENVKQIYAAGKRFFGIGGEHLVTLPAVKAAAQFHDLAVIHFDAHADLREEYLGEEMSHSAVIRHISKFVKDIRQIGIRSGTKEEFDFAHANNMTGSIDDLKGKKIFVTVDLDVLDPSIMSGTGTHEAGGMGFNMLVDWFTRLKDFDIIGADVVELAPDYDASGVSTATAAKVIRELLMVL
jgi:agmatinase